MTTTARERPSGVGVTLAGNNQRVPLLLIGQWEPRLCAEQEVGVNTERGVTNWRMYEGVGICQFLGQASVSGWH